MRALSSCLLFTALVVGAVGEKVSALSLEFVNLFFLFIFRQMRKSCRTKSTSFQGSLEE